MTFAIKAVETKFDNIMFRSRLEARWAFLFKQLHLRYIYEPERFVMYYNNMRFIYMPDFYLIDLNCYVEVKGKEPNYRERSVAWVLSRRINCLVHIVSGQIPLPRIEWWHEYDFDTYTFDGSLSRYPNPLTTKYALNSCAKCGRIEFVPNGDRSLISCACEKKHTSNPSKRIATAFARARMERFDKRPRFVT